MYFGGTKTLDAYLVNNTPKKYQFNCRIKLGLQKIEGKQKILQTPNELGQEQTENILFCLPQSGIIDSYSQLPIQFICKSKADDNSQIWVRKFAIQKENKEPKKSEYTYSAIFEFQGEEDEPTVVHLTGKQICPQVKMDKTILQFGEVEMYAKRDIQIQIQNFDDELPIDFNFDRAAYFHMNPSKGTILPETSINVVCSYIPTGLGNFSLDSSFYLLGKSYSIPLKLYGTSSNMADKINDSNPKKIRGLEASVSDFTQPLSFIEEGKYKPYQKRRGLNDQSTINQSMSNLQPNILQSLEELQSSFQSQTKIMNTSIESTQIDQFLSICHNKKKYNDYLKVSRMERAKKVKETQLKQKMKSVNQQLKDMHWGNNKKVKEDADEEEKDEPPHDLYFEFGMERKGLQSPKLPISKEKELLFVTKPVGRYEPIQSITEVKRFVHNPNTEPKKLFFSEARSHAEIRDCTQELNGEELQLIFADPIRLKFGQIFIKSSKSQTFAIRNDLRASIMVQLDINNKDELKKSNTKPQIIPPGQIALFEVVFYSSQLLKFNDYIKYIINGKHVFQLSVEGEVIPTHLDFQLNSSFMKFTFPEESSEMEMEQSLKIINSGNAAVKFMWQLTAENKLFTVLPLQGEVPKESSLTVKIKYKPQITSGGKTEEEKLVMKVEDGYDQLIKVIGQCNEGRLYPKDTIFKDGIHLGQISVSKRIETILWLKNNSRQSTVYEVDDKVPQFTEIVPRKCRVAGDDAKPLKIIFYAQEECEIKDNIILNIRGSKPLIFPFSVEAIIPQLQIIQEDFDFGRLTTHGQPGQLSLTIQNNSNIMATLLLDLRDIQNLVPGLQLLQIALDNGKNQQQADSEHPLLEQIEDDTNTLPSRQGQRDESSQQQQVQQQSGNFSHASSANTSFSSEISMNQHDKQAASRNYKLNIPPRKNIYYFLSFCPEEPRQYHFELPLLLAGLGRLPSLTRVISVEGLPPQLTITPTSVQFPKKIILGTDKSVPSYQDLSLNNETNEEIEWYIPEDALSQEHSKIFIIQPNSGTLLPFQSVPLKIGFNPIRAEETSTKIPIFTKSPTQQPQFELQVEGEGVFPKLLFDRHYVVMPIVPLGVTSKCTFRIINDGYENLNLIHNIPNDSSLKSDKIDLQITYPDGKNLGITKSKIRVDIAFVRKRPLSFTTKLEFMDDQGWTYTIQVSASTDNSLLTNFSYLQRCKDEFKIYVEENRPITLIEEFADDEDTGSSILEKQSGSLLNPPKSKNPTALSQKSSAKSSLGYHPISINILENLARGINRWMKCFAIQTPMQSFPGDIISNNGTQIFELLQYLTGKYPAYKAKLELASKKQEKVQMIVKQYEDLIRSVKENGGQLNTIRPQYLLSFHDYLIFCKTQPTQEQTLPSRSTLSEPKFHYISLDSWIMLFYQIIKIYLLARVNQKPIKSFPISLPEYQQIPDYYQETSNIYTTMEVILLRWMEIHYNIAHPHSTKRFSNFDSDLRNGLVFQALLLNYVNTASLKQILNLKQVCSSEEDYKYNAEKILLGLQEIGLQTHIDAIDLAYPLGPSLLLFLLNLFFTLPHYIPKSPALLFSCVLGNSTIKTLQLNNPTQKPISYNVKYEGHPDFIISDDSVKLEAKSITNFKILFQSRISQPVSGRLIFTNKRESNFQAAPLVFELKSNITERVSIEQWNVETPLYSCLDKRIDVTNIFTSSKEEYADFQIKLLPILPPTEIINPLTTFQQAADSSNKKKKKLKKEKQPAPLSQQEQISAFFCPRDWLRIKRGETQPLVISFLPFSYHKHHCKIIFCDSNVGEFQHEITGNALLPEPLPQEIKPNMLIYAEVNNQTHEANIHFRNDSLLNAKKILETRLNQTGKVQLKEQMKKFFKQEFPETQTFQVDIMPQSNFQNIIIPGTITVNNPYLKGNNEGEQSVEDSKKKKKQLDTSFDSKKSKDSAKNNKDFFFDEKLETNKLPISFNFKQPEMSYKCNIVMKNETLTDIRIYKLSCQVISKPVKATIEMKVACGEELKQDIPFVNNTDKDWNIKANLITNNEKFGYYFSGPKEIIVKHKSTANYQLAFRPATLVKSAEAKLLITNPFTHDQYEYDLIGHAEEPLAKEHIVMNCIARQVSIQTFEISNPYTDQEVTYRVETDLINPEGEPQFTIAPGQKYTYKLVITPLMGGIYTGQITFIESDNESKYVWYTLCINTSRPRMEKHIELNSLVRKTVAFDISIHNPLPHPTTFEAIIEGTPYLSGPGQFTIPPGSNSTYELLFTPLQTFQQLKGSLSFLNQDLGEIWYGLTMNSTEAPVQKLPTIKAELGKQSSVQVQLENPSQYAVQVYLTNSNPENFSLKDQGNLRLEPFSIKPIEIIYTPSELDVNISAELNFVTEEIGQWFFLLYGVGIPPTEYPEKKVESLLNNEETTMIVFKNPFKDTIPVVISIESTGEHNKNGWNLLLKKTKITLPGFQLLQIPFSFNPREINDYFCVIILYMNEKVQWRYPIKGLAECAAYTTTFNYKTKCRIPLDQQLRIHLEGLPQSLYDGITEEEFYIELDNVPQKDQNIINRSLELRAIKKCLKNPEEPLVYSMSFLPMKPLNTSFDLCVFRKLGGLWKFKMFLEATIPEVDDVITIHSPLNQTTSISFKLSNKYKQFSPFIANFTPDSAPEFSVLPKTGELAPLGREGKNFIISFTPIEYSQAKTGMLIIQTDELYWSFLIKGTFPQYTPPQVPISIIDDHLDQGYVAQKSNKNFLLHNIKSSKFPPMKNENSNVKSRSKLKQSQQIKNAGYSSLSSVRKSMF